MTPDLSESRAACRAHAEQLSLMMCHRRHTACGVYSPPIATHRSRSSRPVPPPLVYPTSSSGPPTPWYSPFATSTTTPAVATCGKPDTVPSRRHCTPQPPLHDGHARGGDATPSHRGHAHAGDALPPVHQDIDSPISGPMTGDEITPLRASTTGWTCGSSHHTRTPTVPDQKRRRCLPGHVPRQRQTGDERDPHYLRRIRRTVVQYTPVGKGIWHRTLHKCFRKALMKNK